jgi:uncharacterized membrane protein
MLPKRIPPQFIIFGILLVIVIVLIQIQVFSLVLSRLGLSPSSASLLLVITLLGSAVNLPLFKISSSFQYDEQNPLHHTVFPYQFREGYTIIAMNVGGALIPLAFSSYLTISTGINLLVVILATSIVSTISYLFSRPIANMGIGMPLFIAPISAAFTAMILSKENAPALAYICGSIGVVIGADLLRIKDIRQLNTPIASIGGAGTFDGIFMTGIIAVLLTY